MGEMPQDIQTGKAVLYGITNSGAPISISAIAGFLIETAKISHKFEIEDVKDELNFDAAAVAVNGHMELDLAVAVTGTTRADAVSHAVTLPPLSKVTTSGFAVDLFNGDWQYRGDLSIDLSHKTGKWTIKVRKYDDPDQNASLTTLVVG